MQRRGAGGGPQEGGPGPAAGRPQPPQRRHALFRPGAGQQAENFDVKVLVLSEKKYIVLPSSFRQNCYINLICTFCVSFHLCVIRVINTFQ